MAKLFGGLVGLMFIFGAPIFAVLLGMSLAGSLASDRAVSAEYGGQLLKPLQQLFGNEGPLFATIPLFIFAGYLLAESKAADRFMRLFNAIFGALPGGLAIATVFACAIFTTFTGASGVTIVALGGLLMPALVKQRYSESTALGLVTGTGSIGLLFIPAVPLFVYAGIYGVSHTLQGLDAFAEFNSDRFLLAGLVPGLLLCLIVSSVAVVIAIKNKVPRQKFAPKRFVIGFFAPYVYAPEVLLLPVVLAIPAAARVGASSLGGAHGLVPAAAFAVLFVFILEVLIFREIKLDGLKRAFREAIVLSGAILLIIVAAAVFTDFVVINKVPDRLISWIESAMSSKLAFLLALNLLLIVIGMMMDIFSAIVIVVPLIAPVAVKVFGIDPYHLGIIFLVNLEIGYLTPPVGLNLFVSALRFNKPVAVVMKATLPFLGAMVASLILVTFVPSVVWVPPKARTLNPRALIVGVRTGKAALEIMQDKTSVGPSTLTFKDCFTKYDLDDRLYVTCENLFRDLRQCENDDCRDITRFVFASGLDCAQTALSDCKGAKKWAEKREVCDQQFSDDEAKHGTCIRATDAQLAQTTACVTKRGPEALDECAQTAGIEVKGSTTDPDPDTPPDQADAMMKCMEMEPGPEQDACLEKITKEGAGDNGDNKPPVDQSEAMMKCMELEGDAQDACIDKLSGAGQDAGDEEPDKEQTKPATVDSMEACMELEGDAQDACIEKLE